MGALLEQITQPNDIKKIAPEDYERLAVELRRFLLETVSRTGGHLAANLGVVELTMALHLLLDFPKDKLIFDVGHQAYCHKLLTGRLAQFSTLRQLDGLSGFPKRRESDCDAFDTGHSSTSISAALGFVKARELTGGTEKIVAVIGDGALTGGMAFEALNNAGQLKSNLIIVLNDNKMSISENVGAMANYLGRIRTNQKYVQLKGNLEEALGKLPRVGEALTRTLKRSKDSLKHLLVAGMLFENMGLTYIGPIDGHNIAHMQQALLTASQVEHAVLVHVVTQKGRGFLKAEKNPSRYHGIEPFNRKTGELLRRSRGITYTEVFGDALTTLAKEQPDIVAVCAAMQTGTGLGAFAQQFPKRFFDVGIAEEHAVTFAAGLAAAGLRPVVAVYSTFLQRAYDQVVHDVCLTGLPVVFAVDRAGIVGSDGETHQGIFDLAYLGHIPNLTVLSPKNETEFREMLRFAFSLSAPVVLRYPRGQAYTGFEGMQAPLEYGKAEWLYQETDIALLAAGTMVAEAEEVRTALKARGYSVSLINLRFFCPFDEEMLQTAARTHRLLVTIEDNIARGGIGERAALALCEIRGAQPARLSFSLPDAFLEQGKISELRERYGLTAEQMTVRIAAEWERLCLETTEQSVQESPDQSGFQ